MGAIRRGDRSLRGECEPLTERYPLETLLDVRRRIETSHARRAHAAEERAANAEMELSEFDVRLEHFRNETKCGNARELEHAHTLYDLQQASVWQERRALQELRLAERRLVLLARRDTANEELERNREALRKAQIDRQSVSRHREKWDTEQKKALEKREDDLLDEHTLARWRRS